LRAKLALLVFLIASLLSGCGFGEQASPTAAPTSPDTPTPQLTATPVIPLTILLLPADMDKTRSANYQKVVYDLAQSAGMRFQVRNTLQPADLDPGLKIVIALPPDPGIAALAAVAPQAQFLSINIPNIKAGGNVSVLSPTSQVDLPAFIAGYAGAMISNDYHVGMIIPDGNPDAQKALVAFTNGMSYYCGLCRPFYYLPYAYPQYIPIPPTEDKARYPGYANYLIVQRRVDTIYVYPDIAVKQLMDSLGTTGVQVMGNTLPDPKPSGWVMTIRPDETKAIQNAWPSLMAGKGGLVVKSPLGIADVNPTLLTPGRQRLVQQVLDDLISGRISTGVNP
jgi:hypothetical protein